MAAADVDVLLVVRPSFLAAESLIPAIRHVHRVVQYSRLSDWPYTFTVLVGYLRPP